MKTSSSTKLKTGMTVIYVDINLVDKTEVIEVNKAKGIAKLSNGITLNREVLKKGYFKRAGMRSSTAKAYLLSPGSEGEKIYKAYQAKVSIKKLLPKLTAEISIKDLESDGEWLIKLNETLERYVG